MWLNNVKRNVWYIQDNNLKFSEKIVSRFSYKGFEISILKSEKDWDIADFLIKDKDNIYWSLAIVPVKMYIFTKTDQTPEEKEYCEKMIELIQNFDFKKFWISKIEKEQYFNKCELKYIKTHYPDIYEKAQKTRELVLEKREQEDIRQENERIQKENEEVKKVNTEFNKKIKELKYKIFIGELVKVEDLEFYKDNK